MFPNSHCITTHLLSQATIPLYSQATLTHPFLASAADGTLSNSLLSFWLYQDRIYASNAYPRFIGSLIANIDDDPKILKIDNPQRILKILVFSLNNILREIEFFESTAKKWGLDLNGWKERKGTRDYTAEMVRVANSKRIEEGLLFLWAMEKVYLDAWSRVHDNLGLAPHDSRNAPVMSFATNWSTPDFKHFVEDLAILVDDLYQTRGEDEWKRAEDIWARVIELEEGFWPKKGEEVTGR